MEPAALSEPVNNHIASLWSLGEGLQSASGAGIPLPGAGVHARVQTVHQADSGVLQLAMATTAASVITGVPPAPGQALILV